MDHQEEEFLAVARRLLRSGQEHAVLFVRLSGFPLARADSNLMTALQNNVRDVVLPLGAQCFALRSGDFFITGQGLVGGKRARIIDGITASTIADRDVLGDVQGDLIKAYAIPRDWVELREHTSVPNSPEADGAPRAPGAGSPSAATGTPAAAAAPGAFPAPGAATAAPGQGGGDFAAPLDGPLNSRMLPRIEDMLGRVDFSRYIQRQIVYETDHKGAWRPLFVENSTDVAALRRDHFPGVDTRQSAHLFLELCRIFDGRMLRIAQAEAGWTRSPMSMNLSLATLRGAAFRSFAEVCRPERRSNVILELHRADVFVSLGGKGQGFDALREAGWRIALDGVTPAVLPYINVGHKVFDFVKVVLQRDELTSLTNRECLDALKGVERDRLIFSRCDHEGAMDLARALGVTRVQGDVVDRLAANSARSRASAERPRDARARPRHFPLPPLC